jgi:hypothetical protein
MANRAWIAFVSAAFAATLSSLAAAEDIQLRQDCGSLAVRTRRS